MIPLRRDASLVSQILVCAILALTGCRANSDSGTSIRGTVYYFSFEVQRMVGIPEAQIEEYGCKYYIAKDQFHRALREMGFQNGGYEAGNVRAKILFEAEEPYFIDAQGFVRHGKEYGKADKKLFAASLLRAGDARCGH